MAISQQYSHARTLLLALLRVHGGDQHAEPPDDSIDYCTRCDCLSHACG